MTTLPTQKTYFQLHPLVSLPEMQQWIQSPTGKDCLDRLPEGAIRIEQFGHGFNLSVSDQWYHTFHTPPPKVTLIELVKCLREAEANHLVYRIPIGVSGWKPSPIIHDRLVKMGVFQKNDRKSKAPEHNELERQQRLEEADELAEYNRQINREINCDH